MIERFVATLARQLADDVTGRVNQKARRPGIDSVRAPDRKVRVVYDRMFDLIAENDAADVFSVFFVFKFGGVNADDYQFIRILFLELLQIRNDVHAVDATVSPKIQQHDFAFQGGERQRFVSIQPTAIAFEFRGANPSAFLYRHFQTFLWCAGM